MRGDVLGGGVVVALAAALWLAYLIPVWLRRREYLATERNAVRLQQTLRILAETSELPDAVRYEANARTVAEQQRILKRVEERASTERRAAAEAQARRDRAVAEAERAAADEAERAALAAIAMERASRAVVAERAREQFTAPIVSTSSRRRIRRARAAMSVILLVGLLGAIGGAAALVLTGVWVVLAASACLILVSVGMLGRLARRPRVATVARVAPAAPVAAELYDHADHDVVPVARPTWTPQPLPKPLHLSRGTVAASAMASIDAATELRRAAARADLEERAARLAPEVAPLRTAAPLPVPTERPAAARVASAPSAAPVDPRFAAMGLVEQTDVSSIDLDAALRRRRAAG